MKTIVYDTKFNENEWFVLITIVVGIAVIYFLPKKLPLPEAIFNLLVGITVGLMLDHTIAVPPLDFYDIGDTSNYNFFDILSYTMYAPFGYVFIYFFLRLPIKGYYMILYVILWTALGIGMEWGGIETGVFHYKNGYKMIYSVPIYLIIQSIHLYVYLVIFGRKKLIDKKL